MAFIKDEKSNSKSWSTFGVLFNVPDGITPRSDEADKYFAGEKYFDIEDLEVF